ncbi:MAG: PTS system sorbose-specific EIIB component [Gemmatimonadaceae bacterium]|nr:PTS system sorbose-specific EIIB component [Gemmatimonadaceae bacterium]
MAIELYRIDDRLIHGQVVVGWGQPLGLAFIVLVDDEVAGSDWEQELYRMGVPPEMHVYFESVDTAAVRLGTYQEDQRPGLLLTADINTMIRLVDATGSIPAVNVGGIHHRAGRSQRLRYVFLTPQEADDLRQLAKRGVLVTAQDVPAARPLSLDELLAGEGNR